jgi:hypothetical protein
MGLMDKFMGGVEKAKEEVADFAETTRLKRDIGRLTEQKTELFTRIGGDVYALHGQGRTVVEVESHCKAVQSLDEQIKAKAEEMTRINLDG